MALLTVSITSNGCYFENTRCVSIISVNKKQLILVHLPLKLFSQTVIMHQYVTTNSFLASLLFLLCVISVSNYMNLLLFADLLSLAFLLSTFYSYYVKHSPSHLISTTIIILLSYSFIAFIRSVDSRHPSITTKTAGHLIFSMQIGIYFVPHHSSIQLYAYAMYNHISVCVNSRWH